MKTIDCTALMRRQVLALGIAVLAAVGGAQAQDDVDTVVVTGSRIRQDPLNQPAPLVTVDDEDIAKSGLTSVGDLLQRLPVSGGGLNTKFNTSGNIGFPPDGGGVGAGAATADLRHLGPKRTLVVGLRYDDSGQTIIDGLRRISKPGRRIYVAPDELAPIRKGLGMSIVSTSKGVMCDRDARAANVGGELLCEVW